MKRPFAVLKAEVEQAIQEAREMGLPAQEIRASVAFVLDVEKNG